MILKRIKELKNKDDLGPIVVFSAPAGCTDELIAHNDRIPRSGQAGLQVAYIVDKVFSTKCLGKYLVTCFKRSLLIEDLGIAASGSAKSGYAIRFEQISRRPLANYMLR